jgi:rubrerythrin
MAFVVNEKLIFDTLRFILDTPEATVKKAVEDARARMVASGERRWPPQTFDENLVSLFDALAGSEGNAREVKTQSKTISWTCPLCKTEHSSDVELITYGGHKAAECPLACPTCGKFTAIYYPETGKVQPRKE